VLHALHRHAPHAPLVYVADSAHAPYGERDAAHVVARSRHVVAHLMAQGAAGVVVACNTATAAAVHDLRAAWPAVPVVGVEPGLKPAAALTRNGRVGVLATPGTLASARYAALLRAQPPGVTYVARPCPGLASLVEAGDLAAPALHDAIAGHVAALHAARVDTVVLGCTHYSFIRAHLEAALGPGVLIVDTADAVARYAAARITVAPGAPHVPRLQTSGDVARLRAIARAWLPFACSVDALPASAPAAS
jgi:glutamate racemase